MFLVNSRPSLFAAAPFCSTCNSFTYSGHPFFRSYGVNLPSSFTGIHSNTLEYSSHLPVSVCGTGTLQSHLEAFLGSMIRVSLCPTDSYLCLEVNVRRIYLPEPSTHLNPDDQNRADLSLLRPPIVQTIIRWYRNIKPVVHRLRPSASA